MTPNKHLFNDLSSHIARTQQRIGNEALNQADEQAEAYAQYRDECVCDACQPYGFTEWQAWNKADIDYENERN